MSGLFADEDIEIDEDYVDEEEDAPEYGDADMADDDDDDDELGLDDADDEVAGLSEDAERTVNEILTSAFGAGAATVTVDDGTPAGEGIVRLGMRDILRLLVSARASTDTGGGAAATTGTGGGTARGGGAGRRYHRLFRGQEDEEEEDADGLTFVPVREPQPRGTELLQGGEFGRVGAKRDAGRGAERHIARVLRQRAQGRRPVYKEDVASHLVPNSNGVGVASYMASAYVGQFSTDSSFYYTCCQDWKLHVYDTTVAPKLRGPKTTAQTPHSDHDTTMSVIKDITAAEGGWTITDSHLSPDNERMIYSSIAPVVHMASTLDSSPVQTPIDFRDRPAQGRRRDLSMYYGDGFGIWSCRFSADGNEVVAGGNGKLMVYDLLADKRTVKIEAHDDDVNSCCWADASANVLISASDDTFCKVWDRRSLGAAHRPAGVLVGHTEGITYVTAKGDGRYVASNGKDQALRLWDLRAMAGAADFDAAARVDLRDRAFDYRYGSPPRLRAAAHPADCSVMTFRGHSVLTTLIRAHFSPADSTGGRYLYSGSADGRIHVWSLDGRVVQVLDRAHTLPMSYDPAAPEPPRLAGAGRGNVCVRDVSWHSQQPVLMSVGWEGRRRSPVASIVARHEWKGLAKLGGADPLRDWVDRESAEYAERAARAARGPPSPDTQRVPGAYDDDSEWTDEE